MRVQRILTKYKLLILEQTVLSYFWERSDFIFNFALLFFLFRILLFRWSFFIILACLFLSFFLLFNCLILLCSGLLLQIITSRRKSLANTIQYWFHSILFPNSLGCFSTLIQVLKTTRMTWQQLTKIYNEIDIVDIIELFSLKLLYHKFELFWLETTQSKFYSSNKTSA